MTRAPHSLPCCSRHLRRDARRRAGRGSGPVRRATNVDWPVYRGDPKGNQYSPLAQIHAANVHRLERAWEYKTGDANQRSTMHANPVVVNGVMYVTTPSLKAVALNAATGQGDLGRSIRRSTTTATSSGCGTAASCTGRAPRASGFSTSCATVSTPWTRRSGALITSFGTERLHRSAAEPRRRSGVGGDRDDVAGRRVQEHPDHRVARQRELRRVARPHPRVRHGDGRT